MSALTALLNPPGAPFARIQPDPGALAATVLIVESDAVLGEAIAEQLAADGYLAELAITASHARALAALRVPKLAVIGDLEEPRGALELLGEIREDSGEGPWPGELPVILVSSRAQELDVLRAFEAGADDFLARPARYLELRARLRAVLRRSESATGRGRLLQVGPLAIDLHAHAVSLHTEHLDLRPLEYELLVQLASAPDRVFAKQELLRSVWGYGPGTATRTVDSHSSRLRRKLTAADAHRPGRWVINVRGVGYRLK
ncbi:MAG TPA: response regulator transcription factor [Solirubrobacteraceae bacterium]|jgi:DNA-binding response OmpR family regulator|nr:response regulator transcription factor [Solirubrobacteraceae bacterium]